MIQSKKPHENLPEKKLYGFKIAEHIIPENTTIGVISDTHIPTRAGHIPPIIFELFRDVSLIIHAGDLVDEKVYLELSTLAPVEAVAGNMDPLVFHKKAGERKIIKAGNFLIGVMHGRGRVNDAAIRAYNDFFRDTPPGLTVDLIVFGHTHYSVIEKHNNTLMFNPGSPIEPRGGANATCGLLKTEAGKIKAEIIKL